MKTIRWSIWIMSLIVVFGIGAADAVTIPLTGSLTDWGITDPINGFHMNNTDGETWNDSVTRVKNGISYWEEGGHSTSGKVGPGYGGAPFDIRGLYFTKDDTYSYFAAIVGMGPDGAKYNSTTYYYMGDIAIGVNNTSTYKYGIVTRDHGTKNEGDFGSVSSWSQVTVSSFRTESDPYSVSAFNDTHPSNLGTSNFKYVQLSQKDEDNRYFLWFIEARVLNSSLGADIITSIHLTESCGNDVANLPPPNPIPVPEPGTMMLLGSGLVGLAAWGRKKYRK